MQTSNPKKIHNRRKIRKQSKTRARVVKLIKMNKKEKKTL